MRGRTRIIGRQRLFISCERGGRQPRVTLTGYGLEPTQLDALISFDDGPELAWPVEVWREQNGVTFLHGLELARQILVSEFVLVKLVLEDRGGTLELPFLTERADEARVFLAERCAEAHLGDQRPKANPFRSVTAKERAAQEQVLREIMRELIFDDAGDGLPPEARKRGDAALFALGLVADELERSQAADRIERGARRVLGDGSPELLQAFLARDELWRCRRSQRAAKVNLLALLSTMLERRRDADDRLFPTSFEEAGWQAKGKGVFYGFALEVGPSRRSFVGTATGLGEMKGDVWTIDENEKLTNTQDLCHGQDALLDYLQPRVGEVKD
jgi:hypothetical protein